MMQNEALWIHPLLSFNWARPWVGPHCLFSKPIPWALRHILRRFWNKPCASRYNPSRRSLIAKKSENSHWYTSLGSKRHDPPRSWKLRQLCVLFSWNPLSDWSDEQALILLHNQRTLLTGSYFTLLGSPEQWFNYFVTFQIVWQILWGHL